MEEELLANHKRYLERKALYKGFGYDFDKESDFVLESSKPIFGKILEVGTGKGHFALALAKAGYRFITFDISADEQRFARLNLAYFGFEKSADFRIENGEDTGFASGSFDMVFSVNVMHHLRDPYKVINEIIRLVSRKGKIVLADFTEEGFKIMDMIHRLEGNIHESGKASLSDMKTYLVKKGFSVKMTKSACLNVLVAERSGD